MGGVGDAGLAPSGALESKRTAGEPVQATGLPHRTSTFHPQSHPVSSCAANTSRPQSLPIQAPGGSRKPAGRGEAAVHFRPAGPAPRPLLRPPPPPPRPGPLLRMSHPRPSARRWGDAVVWAARPPAATTGFPSSRGHAWGQRGPGRDKGSWRAAALPPRRQGHPGERSGSSLRLLRSGALLATTAALETERPPWAPRTETS